MRNRLAANVSLLFVLAAVSGCKQDQVENVKTTVDKAAQWGEKAVETVKQETNMAGSMELATTPPLSAKACYAELIVTGDGRPNVLRLASYKRTELERFPSMIVEARVNEGTLAALVGQTVQATVYAQQEEDGPLWHTPTGAPAPISIESVDETALTAACAGAALVNTENDDRSTVSGKFTAVFP